jgi:predicted Zn-dependent protease
MRKSRQPRRRVRLGRVLLIVAAAVVTGGAVFGLHAVQTRRNAGGLLDRAMASAAAGDHAAAVGHFKNYLKLRPTDADAVGKYAESLEELAKAKPAVVYDLVQVYEKLVRLDPTRAGERRKLVKLHVQTQAFANARQHLTTLFTGPRAADDPELNELASVVEERERKFPEAAAYLRKVLAGPNPSPDAYRRLALLVRTELGSADAVAEADALMQTLVTQKPGDPKAWLARADYRKRTGDAAGARQDVQHAYQMVPGGADDPDVVRVYADMLLAADDLTGAEQLLKKAAARPGAAARTRLALADVQVRTDRPEDAKQTLRELLTAATFDSNQLEAADRLIDLNDPAAVEPALEKFAPLSTFGPVADYLRGRLKLQAGDWAAATPLLKSAADGLGPLPNQRFRSYLGLADAAGQAGDWQGKLDALESALRINPTAPAARFGRADALSRLNRRSDAEAAFQELARTDPAARAAVATLRLAEQLAKPAAERSWEAFDVACGADPLPPEVAVVKARGLAARGRAADAIALLDEVTGRVASPDAVVELAMLKVATGDRAGGLAVLDRAAQREVGDRAAFRLARGRILIGGTSPDWPAALNLARPDGLGQLTKEDRYTLLAGLGDLAAAAGKTADAIDLYQRAVAERPADLIGRAALFNLALAAKDEPLQARMLAEFERIEGPDGPVKATAEAARAVPGLKPGDPDIARWKDRLTAAKAKRPGWGLVHHLLGRLELLAGNADAAAEAYRKAFELGERSEGLTRGLYAALLGRQQFAEAFELLAKAARDKPLPPDLAKELLRLQVAFGDDPRAAAAWAASPAAAASASDQDQVLRADALLAAGQTAAAVEPLKKAVGLNPTNAVAWVALTRVLTALGKEAEAKAAADGAAAQLGKVASPPAAQAAALLAVGVAQEVVGDIPAAESAYRAATAAEPTDAAAFLAVSRLLARNRPAEVEPYLNGLIDTATPAVRRWARRELAFTVVDKPDWYGRLPASLALVEQNLVEGGNLPEDVRAKAVLAGADPLRVAEAVGLLAESQKGSPLSPDQSYHLARLYLRQGRADQAEATLKAALRTTPVPFPELLGLLVRAQVQTRSVAAARQTVEKLKPLDPKGLATAAAEARVLAAEGQPPAAAARLLAVLKPADAAQPLEEIGCAAEAEAALKQAGDPVRLAAFYLRQQRSEEAVRTLLAAGGNVHPGLAARLLAGAVRLRPPALLPEPEKSNWEKTVRQVADWVNGRLMASPTDPQMLAAAAVLETVVGRPERVVPAFERAAAAAPNDPAAQSNLAFARAVYGRDGSPATVQLVEAAMAKGGPAPALLDTRAVVHIVGGRAEPAIRDLTAALAVEPRPTYSFHLAQAYDLLAADRPEYVRMRDDTLSDAINRKGLTKAALDPREWAEFDRLTGKP